MPPLVRSPPRLDGSAAKLEIGTSSDPPEGIPQARRASVRNTQWLWTCRAHTWACCLSLLLNPRCEASFS